MRARKVQAIRGVNMRNVKMAMLLAFLMLLSVGCRGSSPIGKSAPDFVLTSINGKSLKLSDFKGKVVIVDFWSTGCPPCRKGIPEFEKLYSEYKDKGLVVIGISLDRSIDRTRDFCKKAGVSYPIAMGNGRVVGDYGNIRYIPTTFIIDRKMNITEKFVGYIPYETFETKVRELLEGELR